MMPARIAAGRMRRRKKFCSRMGPPVAPGNMKTPVPVSRQAFSDVTMACGNQTWARLPGVLVALSLPFTAASSMRSRPMVAPK
jgi:hypothetical protein